MNTYTEITPDKGYKMTCHASNNNATYILTSAMAHDQYREYMRKYDRLPTAKWYNRNFNFCRTK